jgi:hypothetical protein
MQDRSPQVLDGLVAQRQVNHWGDRFLRDDPENVVTFRHSCGAELHVEMRCAACGEVVAPGDLTGDRDVRRSDIVRTGA